MRNLFSRLRKAERCPLCGRTLRWCDILGCR